MTSPDPTSPLDVVVIGGGAAGLSAALALGRARRSVVVVDAGRPRNAPSPHMHGVLGFDGASPADYLDAGRRDVTKYGVDVVDRTVISATRDADGTFVVELDDGTTMSARRILVATGLTDELPDIDGLRDRWGIDALHCPYCHGWEVRDQAISVISTGPMGVHGALLFRQWSSNVTLFMHTGPALTFADELKLTARGIRTVDGRVAGVLVEGDRLTGLRMESGDVHPTDAVVVAPRMVAESAVLESFGLETVAHALGAEIGVAYEVSATGETSVPGVYAVGNVVDLVGTVSSVVGTGYWTGAMINADLVAADTDDAVSAIGTSTDSPVMDEAFWDRRYNSSDQIWSGKPNPHLVAEMADVEPGRALDVGAGEGADAIWLAERGWTVTAVDISAVALERGRRQAQSIGAEVSDRITWMRSDVLDATLPAGPFDLVSLQFMHFGRVARTALFLRCIDAVAPGGMLQIVAHHPSDLDTTVHRPRLPDFFYAADEIAELLDDSWTVQACDARPRSATDRDGNEVAIHDAVLIATRAAT